ncbi:MAG: hypothetical protein BGO09_11755 [Bacteroidetes bacterium 47-18]|nr:MAG: hypothetical protein BGO09_11755 [Bacteroidetes bacterium 47-18]
MMQFFKSRPFYIAALIVSILGILFTAVYAVPKTAGLPGISKYSSYLIIGFFAFHACLYGKALWSSGRTKDTPPDHP